MDEHVETVTVTKHLCLFARGQQAVLTKPVFTCDHSALGRLVPAWTVHLSGYEVSGKTGAIQRQESNHDQ